MPFDVDKALNASHPVTVEFGGQTLTMQIFCGRISPLALTAAVQQQTNARLQRARERARLERAQQTALEAYADAPADALKKAEAALDKADAALEAFESRETEAGMRLLAQELAEAVKSWDVQAGGEPFPIDAGAIFEKMPWQVITLAHGAAQKAAADNARLTEKAAAPAKD